MKISGTKNKPSGLAGLCSWGEIHTSGRCNGHPRDQVTEMGMVLSTVCRRIRAFAAKSIILPFLERPISKCMRSDTAYWNPYRILAGRSKPKNCL